MSSNRRLILLARDQDTFSRHKPELEPLFPTPINPTASSLAARAILTAIHTRLIGISNKLLKWQLARVSFSTLGHKRRRLGLMFEEVHACWMDLVSGFERLE
jgi:hypothetical protein